MQHFENSELKALFSQLVDAIGTQDAAATFLGVSRQRVGQIIDVRTADLPTWAQVAKLEQVCGQSIVFAALARRAEGKTTNDALSACVAAMAAGTAALTTMHQIAEDGVIEEAEIPAAQRAARKHLEAAQREYDATMSLRPTLKVVEG